jgi:acetylornithine/N-succinyldiaminopimelate aminotransferase
MSLHDRAEAALLPTYPERPFALVRGVGSTLWDEDGNAYLDLVAGVAVCSLGHGHPAAVQALAEQAFVLGHVSNLFYSEPQVALAERLCALSGQDRAFFCNSGAEAVEAAIKLARRTGRARGGAAKHHIVCVEGAFHGRTLATLAAGWSAAKREPFEPVPAGFEHVARNDLAALEAAVGPQTCAVLVEPLQGEGGVWPIDTGWLELARELCDRHGALLLFDEVQTGIGRCGTWFGWELSGVKPDAISLAKGLAGGLPIGALLATDLEQGGFERGDHATTFGGSPPVAAAALAVLDAIEREGLVENARAVGERIRERVTATPGVDHVRGAGLLIGIELAGVPSAEVADALRARGILVNPITPTALRLVPPLCLTATEADRFCAAFEAVLAARLDQHATTVA